MLFLSRFLCPRIARPALIINNMSSPSDDPLSLPFLGQPHDLNQSTAFLFETWNASRQTSISSEVGKDATAPLMPGSRRKCNLVNISLAFTILQATFLDMLSLLWSLNPVRTTVLVFLTVVRGLLPAFRGYSQALILDEASVFLFFMWPNVKLMLGTKIKLQVVITSGDYASARLSRLVRLVLRECCRMLAESLFDSFAYV